MSDSTDRAAYFDEWYADMEHSPVKDEIQQRHLGLPPQLLSTSLLHVGRHPRPHRRAAARAEGTWSTSRADAAAAARCRRDRRPAGRGRLLRRSPSGRPAGRPPGSGGGRLPGRRPQATGLDDASRDAVMCVDRSSSPMPPRGVRRAARVLAPGRAGRADLLGGRGPRRRDPARRLPASTCSAASGAGFATSRSSTCGLAGSERAMWEEAAALDPGDDPPLRSLP